MDVSETSRIGNQEVTKVRKIYVETSVWGMTVPGQPRALREPTRRLLSRCRSGEFLPHISPIVLQKAARAGVRAAQRILAEIDKLEPLTLSLDTESEELATSYIKAGIIPAKKRDDARLVAIATVGRMDILVSWNHRHMANDRKKELFNAVNLLAGYEQLLLLHTPFEVLQ